MANAAVTDTATTNSTVGGLQHIYGTLTIAASPDVYVSGGLAVDFSGNLVKATRPPIWVDFTSANGYYYAYVPGTSILNGKIKISVTGSASTPMTEIAASAIPAGVSGDVVRYHAVFVGQN
jgi:hypothetical protein